MPSQAVPSGNQGMAEDETAGTAEFLQGLHWVTHTPAAPRGFKFPSIESRTPEERGQGCLLSGWPRERLSGLVPFQEAVGLTWNKKASFLVSPPTCFVHRQEGGVA